MNGRLMWVLLLLCSAIQTVSGQAEPEIVDQIIPEVLSQGGSARLNCTVVNKGEHTVIWTFMDSRTGGETVSNDENIYIDNPECKEGYKKYEVVRRAMNNRITYMLVVNCLGIVDYGYYKCYVRIRGDPAGAWPSKIGYLVVQVPPTITSKNDAVMQFDEAQPARLDCTATGVPTPNITWVRSDGSMLPGGLGALYRSTTLQIANVSKADRGLYKCIADNQVRPPDEYLVALNVFFKPDTIAVQDTVGQAQNRQFDAKLECRVSGYPEPELTWFRETNQNAGLDTLEQLTDNAKYDISKQIATTTLRFGEAWYTLRIKNVEANDYTNYYCVAKNRIGRNDSTVISLFETMECQGANCPTFESQGASAITTSILLTVTMVITGRIFVRH